MLKNKREKWVESGCVCVWGGRIGRGALGGDRREGGRLARVVQQRGRVKGARVVREQ